MAVSISSASTSYMQAYEQSLLDRQRANGGPRCPQGTVIARRDLIRMSRKAADEITADVHAGWAVSSVDLDAVVYDGPAWSREEMAAQTQATAAAALADHARKNNISISTPAAAEPEFNPILLLTGETP